MQPLTIALALIRRDGRWLISRRRTDQHLGGLWEFPGGKCEPGETPEQCAVREAFEEVGVHCRALSTLDPIVHAYPERTVRLIPVACEYVSGEAVNHMVDEHRWVTSGELADFAFPEANAGLIAKLIANESVF